MKKLVILFIMLSVSCKNEVHEKITHDFVVQDYSDLFSEVEEQKLLDKIINYQKLTTNEICIYTLDSVSSNKTILYHATTLANTLGVGTEEKNNGLLILISKNNREIAIATGTGTEKTITDPIAKTIIDKTILPKFRDNLYFEGVNKGLDSIFVKWN